MIDSSPFDSFVQISKFIMETLASFLPSIGKGSFLVSINLKVDTFFSSLTQVFREMPRFYLEELLTNLMFCVLVFPWLPRSPHQNSQQYVSRLSPRALFCFVNHIVLASYAEDG